MDHTSRRMNDNRVKDELGAVLGRHDERSRREQEELAAWAEQHRDSWAEEKAAKWTADKRKQAEKNGDALPGGKFPITDQEDMDNAAGLLGNTSLPRPVVVAHMKKQAKKHGLKLPGSLQS